MGQDISREFTSYIMTRDSEHSASTIGDRTRQLVSTLTQHVLPPSLFTHLRAVQGMSILYRGKVLLVIKEILSFRC